MSAFSDPARQPFKPVDGVFQAVYPLKQLFYRHFEKNGSISAEVTRTGF